jgi:hypothetical protein
MLIPLLLNLGGGGSIQHLLPLLNLSTLSLNLIGGSIISNYGLRPNAKNMTDLILERNPSINLEKEISVGGLSFSQAIPMLDELRHTEILIMYFGTSIGWPRISRKMENHLRPEMLTSTTFHIPLYKSIILNHRIKAKIRHLERNLFKFILYPFGLYKPRHSLEDLPNLIKAIEHIADRKSCLIIWVQHNSLGYRRLWLERHVYKRYYKEILSELDKEKSPHFRILSPGKDFLVQENYSLDGVHLSELGHERMGVMIGNEINQALSEVRNYAKSESEQQ